MSLSALTSRNLQLIDRRNRGRNLVVGLRVFPFTRPRRSPNLRRINSLFFLTRSTWLLDWVSILLSSLLLHSLLLAATVNVCVSLFTFCFSSDDRVRLIFQVVSAPILNLAAPTLPQVYLPQRLAEMVISISTSM